MFTAMESIELAAHAKINLYLEVCGRRANGYHELRSVVVPVSLHDTIVLEPADEIESVFDAVEVPVGGCGCLPASEHNLTTRAACALKAATGYPGGVRIHISKRIPIGGGLGGGSADAAAVLRGLMELWGVTMPLHEVMALGSTLGCDIPALLHGGAVVMEGLGERVTPLELGQPDTPDGRWWLVIVNPGFCVPTNDMYQRHDLALTSERPTYINAVSALKGGDLVSASQSLFNSLQTTVVRKYPLIGMIIDQLEQVGALGAMVSGSGASVFGLARDESHAEAMAAKVKQSLDGSVWTRVVTLLPDGVMAAHGPLTP
ncbi:MAG: 4-(cytidine 5'-diphospho)-2-C-methyl-D-erythritol kinase [Verrucomicrobia bacterium]|jgi:4-diphosphocytidyl-2-C-methyl-D-erythritol kinase|nr:4-(cytidine 5'-diphospho)-2-C-methyl-D-erythritol kinase [Verrucomicrobiota bacterium]MBT7066607.1 4-(cytidine 5'-diphospho)-2-C-methyl-D-erythritol kinase [Verrucomicrobiota bacterium]MBT7699767.1 4-(cytidine 5'-diphospho)-2-C-methyl-D-erythritol kinase [Verrucomicrobiota bacterium]